MPHSTTETRDQAEEKLRAHLLGLPESDEWETYFPSFIRFARSVFAIELDRLQVTTSNEALQNEVRNAAVQIIDEILPPLPEEESDKPLTAEQTREVRFALRAAWERRGLWEKHTPSPVTFEMRWASSNKKARVGLESALQEELNRSVSERKFLAWQREGRGSEARLEANLESARRRRLVADFLKACSKLAEEPMFKADIWRAVGHSYDRQFLYWQRASPRATAEDEKNFSRILAMHPAAFIAELHKKEILPRSLRRRRRDRESDSDGV